MLDELHLDIGNLNEKSTLGIVVLVNSTQYVYVIGIKQ